MSDDIPRTPLTEEERAVLLEEAVHDSLLAARLARSANEKLQRLQEDDRLLAEEEEPATVHPIRPSHARPEDHDDDAG